jgi:CheY-like chemotaxis protein
MEQFSILVVDDDADTLSMLKLALHSQGQDVVTSSNAKVALRLLKSWKPDVLVTDLMMPDLDGVSLIKEVKSQPALAKMPVVVISGYTEEHGERALEAGAAVVIPKPVELNELLAAIFKLSTQGKEQGRKAKRRNRRDN